MNHIHAARTAIVRPVAHVTRGGTVPAPVLAGDPCAAPRNRPGARARRGLMRRAAELFGRSRAPVTHVTRRETVRPLARAGDPRDAAGLRLI